MEFSDVAKIGSLAPDVWEAAALVCLERRPLRYTELGAQMALWSGLRVTDGTVTRTVKELDRASLIARRMLPGSDRYAHYVITDAGRARLDEIRRFAADAKRPGLVGGSPEPSPTSGDDAAPADTPMMTVDDKFGGATSPDPDHGSRAIDDAAPAVDMADLKRPTVDTSVAHPARRYNYWLGGKDHFAADRASGDEFERIMPTVRTAALENRHFQRRAVEFLAATAGIDQFLDIGTGIPAPDNTHDVAQRFIPSARVVYVDNDPIVLAHARALMTSKAPGATAYIDADLRNPDKIITHPDLLSTLDLNRPVALLLIAILHFIPDTDHPHQLVKRLVQALPSGSYLAISHATQDFLPPEVIAAANAAAASGRHGSSGGFRTRDEVLRFFDGLELVAPGVWPVAEWRATDEPQPRPTPQDVPVYGGLARIP